MNGTMMEYPLTLDHLLDRAQKLFGGVEIVSRLPDKSLHRHAYNDLHRRARALAGALIAAGLGPGDRVATLMWNHYVHLEAYFGAPLAGGVFHTLNPRLHPSDIAYIMNHARDRFLIIDDTLLPLFDRIREHVKVERVIVVALTGKPLPDGCEDYEEFLRSAPDGASLPALGENQAAGMCYTSATTGRPKGVVYSHRALVLHSFVCAMADTLGISGRDSVCPVVPMFHANAWGVPFTCTMVGAKQVLPGPHLDPVSLLDLFESEGVTVTAGVPTIWLGILQALEREPSRWKLVPGMRLAVGGAAAPEAMIRGYDRFGLQVVHAWGMTETTPVGSVSVLKRGMESLPPDERYAYRAKQGIAPPFVDMRVMAEGKEMPWDGASLGELQVRGPWITASYYDLPEASGQFTQDGWFCTGDVACIDAEGYMKIVDRTKDLIKSGGEWISSVDLENALMGHPAVAEAAVIAVPHPKWGERPLAAVVPKEQAKGTFTPGELRDFIAPKFPAWWLPDAVIVVDEIPRTAAGKFLKRALREKFQDWKWEEGGQKSE